MFNLRKKFNYFKKYILNFASFDSIEKKRCSELCTNMPNNIGNLFSINNACEITKHCKNSNQQQTSIEKKIFRLQFILAFCFIILLCFSNFSYGVTPKIVNKLSSAFDDIEGWMIKLSTPAAAVAVGVGLFMKKFSFGDEERLRMAKKVIRGSLVSYGMLLGVNLILAAIKALID